MERPACPFDATTEGRPDGLVAQADAEQGDRAGQLADGGERDAGLGGRAGAGRDHDRLGGERPDAGDIDGVVAHHPHGLSEFLEVPHHVEDEGIVIVDDEDHGALSPSGSNAWNTRAALVRVSSYSRPGSDSRVTPPPA